jgi:hypothetical protein
VYGNYSHAQFISSSMPCGRLPLDRLFGCVSVAASRASADTEKTDTDTVELECKLLTVDYTSMN